MLCPVVKPYGWATGRVSVEIKRMAKVFNNPLSTFDLFKSGALIFGNSLLSSGLSDAEALARLQERYPSQDQLDLEYVLQLTHEGQQAASELADLPPGFTNPPSAIPVVPGVETGGYILDVYGMENDAGEIEPIRRVIESDKPLSFDELLAIASTDLRDAIQKSPELWKGRNLKPSQVVDIEAQLAWFKG